MVTNFVINLINYKNIHAFQYVILIITRHIRSVAAPL